MKPRPSMRDVEDLAPEDVGLSANKYPCYAVSDPAALIQTIGWMKSTSSSTYTYFRGQSELFGGRLVPSGLRSGDGAVATKGVATHDRVIRAYIDDLWGSPCDCGGTKRLPYGSTHLCSERAQTGSTFYRGLRRATVEPLLQHYGVRTRWVDLVDNIWIALWFACHEYRSADHGRFAYLRRRAVLPDAYAYLLVLDLGALNSTNIPGYATSAKAQLIDLRYAIPSTYLRPHAQHGLLVAPPGPISRAMPSQLESLVRAAIRIELALALEWLGHGGMVSTYTLFPPAVRDEGYRMLLSSPKDVPDLLGSLTQIGTGI